MNAKTKAGIAPDKPFDPSEVDFAAPDRGALRGSMRESAEDSKARADQRMAELRGLHGDHIIDEGNDKFAIDRDIIPDGWDYEWKRNTVLGKGDPAYETALARSGWEPVPTGRHPQYMPHGTPGSAPIMRDGNILMERPLELTQEAQRNALRQARNQVRIKEEQLTHAPGPGQFPRDNKGAPLASVKKSYAPMPVPE